VGWGGEEVSTKKSFNGMEIYQFCNNSTWWVRKQFFFVATRLKQNTTSCANKLLKKLNLSAKMICL
jgi:hypothetical protein